MQPCAKTSLLLLSRRAPSDCLLRILSKCKMRMYLRRGCLAPAYLIVTQGCISHEWKQECGFKISHSEEHCMLIKSCVVMCLQFDTNVQINGKKISVTGPSQLTGYKNQHTLQARKNTSRSPRTITNYSQSVFKNSSLSLSLIRNLMWQCLLSFPEKLQSDQLVFVCFLLLISLFLSCMSTSGEVCRQ